MKSSSAAAGKKTTNQYQISPHTKSSPPFGVFVNRFRSSDGSSTNGMESSRVRRKERKTESKKSAAVTCLQKGLLFLFLVDGFRWKWEKQEVDRHVWSRGGKQNEASIYRIELVLIFYPLRSQYEGYTLSVVYFLYLGGFLEGIACLLLTIEQTYNEICKMEVMFNSMSLCGRLLGLVLVSLFPITLSIL